MATLNSPGVAVTVIDESFYTPAEPGTTPLIVVATSQDKTNGAGTGTALATTKAQAGKAFRVTSQRDLVDLFGVPFFEKTASGSPVHAGERNEYGLLAAYSLLGVSNSAFIVRADIDLAQLEGSATAPGAEPTAGQWWLDTANSLWGVQEWDSRAKSVGGQKFVTKTPIVITAADVNKFESGTGFPATAVGVQGDYAVVARSNQDFQMFYKNWNNAWTLVGSNDWSASRHAVASTSLLDWTAPNAGSFVINTVTVDVDAGFTANDIAARINTLGDTVLTGVTARVEKGFLYISTSGVNSVAGDSSLANALVIEAGPEILVDGSNVNTFVTSDAATALLGIKATTYFGPVLDIAPHTQVPLFKRGDLTTDDATPLPMEFGRPSGSVWLKTTTPGNGADIIVKRWDSALKIWTAVAAPLYANGQSALYALDRSGGGLNIATNAVYVQYNSTEDFGYDTFPKAATSKLWRRANQGATVIIAPATGTVAAPFTFTISESVKGSATMSTPVQINVTAGSMSKVATAVNGAGLAYVKADVTSTGELVISHSTGGEIRFAGTGVATIGTLFTGSANFYQTPGQGVTGYTASNWAPLSTSTFVASGSAPLNEPTDGQLWYNPEFSEVDIMVHNGTTWVGYRTAYSATLSTGPIVAAAKPAGSSWVDRQLWISTADTENFPTIYRWNNDAKAWDLVDKTDQTSEDGILFADARAGTNGGTATSAPTGTIAELLTSDFLDTDAPDPALYPKGMLLWNTRRSGGNVKKYNNGYIDTTARNTRFGAGEGDLMSNYFPDRWTTASANQEDGSGTFGRKAQHAVVVAALKSVVDTSAEIRDEERRNFNLIAAPGYPELLSNLINLNIDRGITAFVVGDTPFRLASDATTLTNWGSNANGALDNNETGIVSYDEYCSVFYPQGYTTDLSGSYAVVPASHMMLKTIALSDQVSYPWFAPAGTRRGGITNATAVGYIDAATGEFQQVSLNEGQRDVLYDLKVNPITFFNGVGLVNYGQKTRGKNASALDRINVARLTVYLRSQLSKLARPYVFEPNDKITRDEIKGAVESLLLELVSLRAIYDFAVVCDESNNTPARIDRNELYVDVAIEPVKAVEFIYIPLRVKNTGEL